MECGRAGAVVVAGLRTMLNTESKSAIKVVVRYFGINNLMILKGKIRMG
jgi:hypothetical protein